MLIAPPKPFLSEPDGGKKQFKTEIAAPPLLLAILARRKTLISLRSLELEVDHYQSRAWRAACRSIDISKAGNCQARGGVAGLRGLGVG